jgi:hypothetical protein
MPPMTRKISPTGIATRTGAFRLIAGDWVTAWQQLVGP